MSFSNFTNRKSPAQEKEKATLLDLGFPGGSVVKDLPANVGDLGWLTIHAIADDCDIFVGLP